MRRLLIDDALTLRMKILQILRVYKEGFDINNYSNMDLNQSRWNSWAVDVTTFNKQ